MHREHGVELAVVGGGILGAMTAWFARRRWPRRSIAILDRSMIGAGATQYSAFLDLPYGATPGNRALSARSRVLYAALRAELPELPIRDLAMYGVCASAELERTLSRLSEPGAERIDLGTERRVPGAPAAFRVPPGDVVFGGLRATRCADSSLVERVIAAVERAGPTLVLEGAEVVRAGREGDRRVLDVHDGRRLVAREAVVCIGPWLARGIDGLGGGPSVRIKKVVTALLPAVPPPEASHIYLFDHDAFLLPQPERGRWLMSFRSNDWDCAPAIGELRIGREDWRSVGELLARYLPEAEGSAIGARAFCDGYTDSREPVMYRDAVSRFVILGGCSGSGVRLAPALAERAIAELND